MTHTLCGVLAVFALATDVVAQTRTSAVNDEAAIKAIEQLWDAATLKSDAAALDTIFADNFISTGADGTVRTKAEMLSEMKAGNIKYESAKTDDVKIILHGDAAVVSGRWAGSYVYRGKTVDLIERFTNFYARQGGRWRCVASHGSAIK
jgi:ketosteroid isomerase-like protein